VSNSLDVASGHPDHVEVSEPYKRTVDFYEGKGLDVLSGCTRRAAVAFLLKTRVPGAQAIRAAIIVPTSP